MPEFISKVQHKTYEKGEFSDEKARNLAETIDLIKKFTWDDERALTAVQLTGPSITIQDEDVNYLKVGYLDNENHLYEYYAPNIDDACKIVTDFFNGQLDLEKFDKHFFNIGNQANFLTKYFEYKVKFWKVLLISWPFIMFFLIFLIFFIAILSTIAPLYVKVVPCILTLILGGVLLYIFRKYLGCSNQVLQISKGNDIFSFSSGYNETSYDKRNIKEIIIYRPAGGRTPNMFYVYEIHFKDDTVIKFSNMLISDITFGNKFSFSLCRYSDKNSFRQL